MAQFTGTIKEFTKFIGSYARIKVQQIASIHKKKIGKCEECGLVATQLDAAHIQGKERPLLIADILSQFEENDKISIDLNEFEERFVEAHLPIESTIRILCKPCHRIYDKQKLIDEAPPIEFEFATPADLEEIMIKEGNVIQTIINNKEMDKNKALRTAKEKGLTTLDHANTRFSNIVGSQNNWWFELDNKMFESDLHFIVNNDQTKSLHIFRLPANTIKNPEKYFKQRNDNYRKNSSDIYVTVSGTKFIDKKGFDFGKFLVETIRY